MTFQEILEGITRHRAKQLSLLPDSSQVNLGTKIEQIEWALQALAEALRDREAELSAVAPHERAGHSGDAREEDFDEVDEAFDEYEKRK